MAKINTFVFPFERIAGGRALLWGIIGIAVCTVLSIIGNVHFGGLMKIGGGVPNSVWRHFVAEHLIIWIVPALLVYLGGLIFSKSKIRPLDVFGTVAFAELPLIGLALASMSPPMQLMFSSMPDAEAIRNGAQIQEMVALMNHPQMRLAMFISLLSTIFIVWMLIWMYGAMKVSCNLRGWQSSFVFVIAVLGGDMLCRFLIGNVLLGVGFIL